MAPGAPTLTRRALLGLAAGSLTLAAAGLAGCAKLSYASNVPTGTPAGSGRPRVRVAYLPITHALPLFEQVELLSGEEGRSYDIELVRFGTWPELMDALNTGKVWAAPALIELGMRARQQGIDIRAAALGHRDGNVIVARPEIATAADLAGATIAIPARQSSHYLLVRAALDREGISLDDVTIVELAPTEMPAALACGQVDAYCVAEPFGAKAVEAEVGRVIERSEELWESSICCALFVNRAFADEGAAILPTFLSDYHRAGAALADTDTALAVGRRYLGQKADVLKTSLAWITFDDLTIREEDYDDLTRRMREAGLTDDPPAFGDFVLDADAATAVGAAASGTGE